LAVVYFAAALALIFTGPGEYSLDRAFGIRLPRALVIVVAAIASVAVAYGIAQPKPEASPDHRAA